jgi:PAS domain-containing protein
MDATDDPTPPPSPAVHPPRRVTVPISFTGDIAGFLFDLLSDIEAIVWEADADTLAVEFVNDRVLDLLGYEPMDVIAVPHFWSRTIVHPDDRELYLASGPRCSQTASRGSPTGRSRAKARSCGSRASPISRSTRRAGGVSAGSRPTSPP